MEDRLLHRSKHTELPGVISNPGSQTTSCRPHVYSCSWETGVWGNWKVLKGERDAGGVEGETGFICKSGMAVLKNQAGIQTLNLLAQWQLCVTC